MGRSLSYWSCKIRKKSSRKNYYHKFPMQLKCSQFLNQLWGIINDFLNSFSTCKLMLGWLIDEVHHQNYSGIVCFRVYLENIKQEDTTGMPDWHPEFLADQLTLSQQGGADCAHHITTGTSKFLHLPVSLYNDTYQTSVTIEMFNSLFSDYCESWQR